MSEYPKFFTFNLNRRVYKKDEKGIGRGGPIYAEHFELREVIGETDKAYLTDGGSINKRSMKYCRDSWPREKYSVYTESEREAMIWKNDHRRKLVRVVERCDDVSILKQIAMLVGYEF